MRSTTRRGVKPPTSGSIPTVKVLPISELTLDDRNANKGTDRGRAMLEGSLKRLGAGRSVLVDCQGRIIAGNKTVEQALKLGMQKVALIESDGKTLVAVQRNDLDLKKDKKAVELAIRDNRVAELDLDWNTDVLKALDIDFKKFWDDKELRKLFTEQETIGELPEPQIGRAEELQAKWGTERGQLWQIGNHKLLCGDSTSEADVTRLMSGERACLFATDPPYLVDYDGTNHPHKWNDSEEVKRRKNKDWSDKYTDVDSPILGEALYDSFVLAAINIAITPNAAWYCWHASRKQALLESVWEKHGAFVHQQVIWAKDRPILTRSWYMWQHEPCFFGWIRGNKPKRIADDYPPTIWSFPTVRPGETTDHPTEKPVELFAIPMRQHTEKGDICYEPFSGSGTQLVAAESLGRICYAMELSPPFMAVALERLSEMGLEPKLDK